jgi:predicted DNA-binding protein (UPF0251 family)
MVHNELIMARPINRRSIEKPPLMEGFKPFGIPRCNQAPVTLLFEEYEALRLVDYLGLAHQQAARRMKVSRPTLTRVYEKARHTLATALVEGKAILIEGGHYQTADCWNRCKRCSQLFVGSEAKAVCPCCHQSTGRCLNPAPPAPARDVFCLCSGGHTERVSLRGKPCQGKHCSTCQAGTIHENKPHPPLNLKKKFKK